MAERKTLDEAVVTLYSEIGSQIVWSERAPERDEYRRGYREALTGLRNSGPMMDVLDALKELGWKAPSNYWASPPKAAAEQQPGGE